jgi:HD-GYP domain-containing protein (c-di-GMP phosphodiesterase class II)
MVLVSTVLAMAAATVAIVVIVGGDASRRNAQALFTRIADTVGERTAALFERPLDLALYASLDEDNSGPVWGDGRGHTFFGFMAGALAANPSLYSIYVGNQDGTFLQVIQTNGDPRVLKALAAPEGTQLAVRTINDTGPRRYQTYTFLGAAPAQGARPVLAKRFDTKFDYNPSLRPWFQAALKTPGVVLSDPYTFSSLQAPGVTASVALGAQRVLGVDMTLSDLQKFVEGQSVSTHGAVSIVDRNQAVMAQSQGFAVHPGWLVKTVDRSLAGQNVRITVTAPPEDFDNEFRTMELSVVGATVALLLILLPLTLLFTKRLTRIMTVMSQDVERICQMDFSGEAPKSSRIREFDTLARGFSTMKTTLATETKGLAEAKLKLSKIVETGIALSTEKDSNALCQLILDTAKELTDADGGTLYLLTEDKAKLQFAIMLNDTLGTRLGGTAGAAPNLFVPLFNDKGEENHHNVASHTFHQEETVNIADAYHDQRFDFSGTKKFDEANGYRSKSFLTVPLKPMGGKVLGALQLINTRQSDQFTPDMQSFVEALSASAATAIYNNQLLKNLEILFDAIIDIINGAIGRKSPYTGGHCERVPVIAEWLADATSAVKSGPLAGWSFANAEARREFILGAKLHDVGKVTTPEYVVDKATKLETIYNRIHEVRTRFEVLYRDAVIRRHEIVLADKKKAAEADRELAALKAQLDEEWEFLAKSNLGGEFLSPEKVERIKTIGSRTWLRYFDDRLGLSWEEEFRLSHVEGLGAPKPTLPAQETLLADKPIHVFPRLTPFDHTYKGYNFKTPVPPVLYNQGELYNLAISRGTLTNEEHFKIKEHVMQSIFMLNQLPLPEGLKRVPEIAGEHHETLVGTGYPYQKKAEDLSMESRILTLADIFEALTASDRPYKKAKTLSESIQVLAMFKKDQHIDGDLFDLFLTSGVYKKYAEQYLKPEQIDEVDISKFVQANP